MSWSLGLILNKIGEMSAPITKNINRLSNELFYAILIVAVCLIFLGFTLLVKSMNLCVFKKKGTNLELVPMKDGWN